MMNNFENFTQLQEIESAPNAKNPNENAVNLEAFLLLASDPLENFVERFQKSWAQAVTKTVDA